MNKPLSGHRIAFSLAYNGAKFCGWQKQTLNPFTVEASVTKAVEKVANHPITLHCAGRTDAGVHAKAQVVHFDTTAQRSDRNWLLGIQSGLPHDVSINALREVDNRFHARHSALWRRYKYYVYWGNTPNALLKGRALYLKSAIDVDNMQSALANLIGEHDFSAFRASACQARHACRSLYSASVLGKANSCQFTFTANAFLHHMVRNIVGSCLLIGQGKRQVSWLNDLLKGKNRAKAGPTAPPWGLYLDKIGYPLYIRDLLPDTDVLSLFSSL